MSTRDEQSWTRHAEDSGSYQFQATEHTTTGTVLDIEELLGVRDAFNTAEDRQSQSRLEAAEKRGITVSQDAKERLHRLNLSRCRITQDGRRVISPDHWSMSHLYDAAVEIAHMSPEDQKLSATLHDIGKAGPRNATPEVQKIIIAIFATDHDLFKFADSYEKKSKFNVRDIIELIIKSNTSLHGDDTKRVAVNKLCDALQKVGISPEMKLLDFYRMHYQWGADVLQIEHEIPDAIRYPAMNHHAVLHGQEQKIMGYEATSEDKRRAFLLEVIDFYQAALRRREDRSHDVALEEARKVFTTVVQKKCPDRLPELEEILTYIAHHPLPPEVNTPA